METETKQEIKYNFDMLEKEITQLEEVVTELNHRVYNLAESHMMMPGVDSGEKEKQKYESRVKSLIERVMAMKAVVGLEIPTTLNKIEEVL